jgi:hypothetical protein
MSQECRSRDNPRLVTVPHYAKPLAPVTADRVRRLREHLVEALREAPELKPVDDPCPRPPSGFAARVAATACGLCEGWCCTHGGDDAYLDGHTVARVHRDMPDLGASAVVRLYVQRVPVAAYEDSCIFHGDRGCTLDRSLRADICNTYYCKGLTAYLRSRRRDAPQMVLAGKDGDRRLSTVLMPVHPA